MSRENALGDHPPTKGVKTKLIGFTLVLLGVLDALLLLRGGEGLSGFYVVLIGSGFLIWIIGAIRQRNNNIRHREN